MTTNTCPICTAQFETATAVRDHTWNAHNACQYCGERIDGETEEQLYRHWLAAHPDDLSRVDSKRAAAAVDSLSVAERFSEGGIGAAVGGLTRRQLLLSGGAGIGLVAGATVLSTGGGTESDTGGDTNSVATAPIPDSPSEFRYATMGSADADVTVTYFGSWKCPYCAQFSTEMLPQLVTDYVEPGTIALAFRNLAYVGGDPFLGPDAPTAGRAGLAVWNTDPDSYWPFHEYVLRNQPPESDQWATTDTLVEFAQSAGVSETGPIRTAIQENQYEDALRATDRAASDAGIDATPMLLIDGTAVNPLGNEDWTRQLIEDAAGSS